MKSFRSTAILAALVGLLAAYTIYEYRKADEDASIDRGERKLFSLAREDIEELRIKAAGKSVSLKKTGENWQMLEPVGDEVEAPTVDSLIYSLLGQKGKVFQNKDEVKAINWKDYGLEPVENRIEITGKGRTESLDISTKNAFDGRYYVRFKDELLLGDQGLAHLIQREPDSLRSKKIFRQSGDVDRVDVTFDYGGKKEVFAFLRDKDSRGWSVDPKANYEVDAAKVNGWVEKLRTLMASSIQTENPGADELTAFGLTKPTWVVKIGDWRLEVGQDKATEIFLQHSGRPTVYKLAKGALDSIRVPKEFFREGKSGFTFNVEDVREVIVDTPKVKNTFKKNDSDWNLSTQDKGLELNQERLVRLLSDLKDLEALEYPGRAPSMPAKPQIVLKGADGKILLSLSWGGDYQSGKTWNKGFTLRYVRSSLKKEDMGVSKDKIERLIDDSFVRKVAPPNTAGMPKASDSGNK